MGYRVLSAILFSSGLVISDMRKLNQEAIDAKTVTIEKMVQQHRYAVFGLTALAFAQQIPTLVPALLSMFNLIKNIDFNAKNEEKIEDKTKLEQVGFLRALSRGMGYAFLTGEGWGIMLRFVASGVASHFIVQKIEQQFYHPDSLGWYINTQVPYIKTLIGIKDIVKKMESGVIDLRAKQHNYDILCALCEQLIVQAEDVCAYIAYKTNLLEGNQKVMAERTGRYLLNYYNEAFAQIGIALGRAEVDYNEIKRILALYQSELKYQRKIFSAIELESTEKY